MLAHCRYSVSVRYIRNCAEMLLSVGLSCRTSTRSSPLTLSCPGDEGKCILVFRPPFYLPLVYTDLQIRHPASPTGQYNETIFRGIDCILAQAAKHNLKVVISISTCATLLVVVQGTWSICRVMRWLPKPCEKQRSDTHPMSSSCPLNARFCEPWRTKLCRDL